MAIKKHRSSDILYYYENIPVRRHNIVPIRVDETTYRELIDAEIQTGLSQRKILAYSATPGCERCANSPVKVLVNGREVQIKRGILSKRIPISFTSKKIGHKRNRPVINIATGEIFQSAKEILKFVDIAYSPLLRRLNSEVENNTPFKFVDDYDQSNRTGKEDSQIP